MNNERQQRVGWLVVDQPNSLHEIKFSSVRLDLAVALPFSIPPAFDADYLESKLRLGGISVRRFGFDFLFVLARLVSKECLALMRMRVR